VPAQQQQIFGQLLQAQRVQQRLRQVRRSERHISRPASVRSEGSGAAPAHPTNTPTHLQVLELLRAELRSQPHQQRRSIVVTDGQHVYAARELPKPRTLNVLDDSRPRLDTQVCGTDGAPLLGKQRQQLLEGTLELAACSGLAAAARDGRLALQLRCWRSLCVVVTPLLLLLLLLLRSPQRHGGEGGHDGA
jgi:hypothetical protein